MSRLPLPTSVPLKGVALGPSQILGGIRLVPVLRDRAPGDLRLGLRPYDDDLAVVSLDGELLDPGIKYLSYVPHGLVVRWTEDGLPAAAFETEIHTRDGKPVKSLPGVRLVHRMSKREEKDQLRLLPLHLAMEGFLSLHFGGPEVAWSEYSKRAISRGLSPRIEYSVSGRWIQGLEDALRTFELHLDQVGSIVFVADALATAFVVSHPDDYRRLHRSLIRDFYGELIWHYSLLEAPSHVRARIDADDIRSLADLERALETLRREWSDFHAGMAEGLLRRGVTSQRIYRAGPFQLLRFCTELDPSTENHLGEMILRDSGELEYLKTYRLSAAQTRRAFLLKRLSEHNWNIDATARAESQSREDFLLRMEKAGFGYLIAQHVLDEARAKRRRRK